MPRGEVVIESERIAPNTERNYLRSLRHVVAATDDRVVSKGTEIRNRHKLIVFARFFLRLGRSVKLIHPFFKQSGHLRPQLTPSV